MIPLFDRRSAFYPAYDDQSEFVTQLVSQIPDDLLRYASDAQSIDRILCKTSQCVTVEYALRNTSTPIGVADFVTTLLTELADSLPTVAQMEAELTKSVPTENVSEEERA